MPRIPVGEWDNEVPDYDDEEHEEDRMYSDMEREIQEDFDLAEEEDDEADR
jgi:hypothetical protein